MKKPVALTKNQLWELKWFCDNCTGTRQEFYEVLERVNKFKDKLDRLNKASKLVEKFIKRMDKK